MQRGIRGGDNGPLTLVLRPRDAMEQQAIRTITRSASFVNREAEQAVLGCALLEAERVMPLLLEKLRPEHFYLRTHRLIYQTLIELFERGEPIDLITVGNRLEEELGHDAFVNELGGRSYLSELVASVTTTTSVGYYADILRERARRRELADLGLMLIEQAEKAEHLNGQLTSLLPQLEELLAPPQGGKGSAAVYFEKLPAHFETAWVVQELIAHPRVVGLGGKRAAFKTWIGLHLALCVATGSPVFGHFEVPARAPVLYVNSENPPELLAKRLRMLAAQTGTPPPGSLAVAHFPPVDLRTSAGIAELKRLLKDTTPKLVVVDTIARVWGVREEFNNVEITEAMQALRKLSEEFNVTFVYIHHLRKSPTLGRDAGDALETLRGGSELVNLADAVFVLKRRGEEQAVLMRQGKNRDAQELPPFKVRLELEGKQARLTWEEAAAEADSEVEACAQEIVAWFEGQPSEYVAKTGEIVEAMKQIGYSQRTVARTLKALVHDGTLEKPKRGAYRLRACQLGGDEVGGDSG
jgi:hypothetical protein